MLDAYELTGNTGYLEAAGFVQASACSPKDSRARTPMIITSGLNGDAHDGASDCGWS